MRLLSAMLAGLVFGIGLILSGLTNPAKVLAFLDLAGAWDPSLLFVMGGWKPLLFFGAMLAGMGLYELIERRKG